MSHPAAVVFALSMAVWVADVRFAPAPAPAPSAPVATCQTGFELAAPAGADAELVICGSPLPK